MFVCSFILFFKSCFLRCLFGRLVFLRVGNWCRKWLRVGERRRGMTERPEAMLIRTPSFNPFHSFLPSPCIYTPPSLPSPDDRGSSQIIASLSSVFSLLPTTPLLAPFLLLSLASSLSCVLPPFSLLQSSLPQSPFEPSVRRSAKSQQ